MLIYRRRDLVGDRNESVESVLPRHIEIVFELFGRERVCSCFHLDQCCPLFLPSHGANESIREYLLLAENEGNFDESLESPCGSPQGPGQRSTELLDGRHHG